MCRLGVVATAIAVLVACKQDPGASCDQDTDCHSGLCLEARCETGYEGSRCQSASHCRAAGHQCIDGHCSASRTVGETCATPDECDTGHCVDQRCATQATVAARQAAAEVARQEAARVAEREKEARLLAESGVAPGPVAVEQAVATPGAGTRIRVVTTTAMRTAFAACRSDERLVGGGCQIWRDGRYLKGSYPSGHGAEDTVGARWNCGAEVDVTAYALCAKLP